MEENKFLSELYKRLEEVSFFPKIHGIYNVYKKTLGTFKIIHGYIQKERIGDLHVFTITFFDDKLLHVLVLNQLSIKQTSFPIKSITSVYLGIINDQETLDGWDKPKTDELHLIIKFSDTHENISIITTTREYEALLQIQVKLLTQIACK
jgi:hypothetical protein